MREEFIHREEAELKGIFNTIRKRNFKGYSGMAIKNTSYQFSGTLITKLGSLLFTIVAARLLLPELFGLYSLALGTVIMIASLFEFGVGSAIIKFVSEALSKKDKPKAKSYFLYLLKIKGILILSSAIVLIFLSSFLANTYYNKPIFLALIAGSFYILATGFIGIFSSLFQAFNDFKSVFFKEIVNQILRLTIVPISIILILNKFSSQESILFFIIISLGIVYLLTFLFLLLLSFKKLELLKVKREKISQLEKKNLNRFLFVVSATALSGIFFGYIDMFVLGRYVEGQFIGFYTSALSLVGSLATLITFSNVLFPLFSRIKGAQLERGFKRSSNLVLLLSSLACIGTVIFANLIIRIIYGGEFMDAAPILRIFSLLLIVYPISGIYDVYFLSVGKPKIVAKFLVISTFLNLTLNFFFVLWLLKYSQFHATIGACIATLISRYFYLGSLWVSKKKLSKSKNIKSN